MTNIYRTQRKEMKINSAVKPELTVKPVKEVKMFKDNLNFLIKKYYPECKVPPKVGLYYRVKDNFGNEYIAIFSKNDETNRYYWKVSNTKQLNLIQITHFGMFVFALIGFNSRIETETNLTDIFQLRKINLGGTAFVVPKKYNYAAVDMSGDLYLYIDHPVKDLSKLSYKRAKDSSSLFIGNIKYIGDWKNSDIRIDDIEKDIITTAVFFN